jgi:isoprenylcysteine carboxyl methyltransferase (ICMT) family protein YpbQ
MVTKILFHHPPEELNVTMEFWQEKAQMASCLDNLLHQGPLFAKIFLKFQDVFVATIGCIDIALILALSTKLWLIQLKVDSFWLVCVLVMSRQHRFIENSFRSSRAPQQYWVAFCGVRIGLFRYISNFNFFSESIWPLGARCTK